MINKILGQSSFWIVNKSIAKQLKCNDSALLLSLLIDTEQYFSNRQQLVDDFFYLTSDSIEKELNISYHKQKKCIDILKDNGFIETKLSGIPAKQHFKVIENKILNFLNTVYEKALKLDVKNFETNNNINNNINNTTIDDEKIEEAIDDLFESCKDNYNIYAKNFLSSDELLRIVKDNIFQDIKNDVTLKHTVRKYLYDFLNHLNLTKKVHQNMRSFQTHFNYWLGSLKEKNKIQIFTKPHDEVIKKEPIRYV